MTRGEYPDDCAAQFKLVAEGVWRHPRCPQFKVDKYAFPGSEDKFRVWVDGDIVYSTFYLDRALKHAGGLVSNEINRVCGG